VAQNWIDTCCAEHDKCGGKTESPLPPRAIDVGPADESEEPRLIETSGESGLWTTLSHRWGGPSSFKLTEENLLALKKIIPVDLLPQNFKDAITVTRKLGLRYVWIDSLCIIQNSATDWAKQCTRMSSIYRDSLVTLAACDSANSSVGFLHPRKSLHVGYNPFLANGGTTYSSPADSPVTTSFHTKGGISGTITIRKALQPYKFVMEGRQVQTNVLKTRGSILQESILSPRTIHFSTEQAFWQCRSVAFAESDIEPVEFDYWPSYHWQNEKDFFLKTDADQAGWMVRKGRSPDGWMPPKEFYSIRTKWLRTVKEMSSRILTFPDDKLPALSGVAAEFSRMTGSKYLAGLWDVDLHRGLLWNGSGTIAASKYRAPSWSWASRECVEGERFSPYYYPIKMVKQRMSSMLPLRTLRLQEIDMLPATEDLHGALREGSCITITGNCLMPEKWTREGSGPARKIRIYPTETVWPKNDSLGISMPLVEGTDELKDGAAEQWADEYTCIFVAELKMYSNESDIGNHNELSYWGLALRRLKDRGPDAFARVGITNFGIRAALAPDAWEYKTIKVY
jgi:hypothetical protein